MSPDMSPIPGVIADTASARLSVAAPAGRLSLRARGDLGPLEAALGLSLPSRIGTRSLADGVEALRLGPDEWVILCPAARVPALVSACAGVYDALPHSLVDISGRERTLVLDGPGAIDCLSFGAARDIAAIPVGEARRLNFDGLTVLLWRDAATGFRIDTWTSHAGHVAALLKTAALETAFDLHAR